MIMHNFDVVCVGSVKIDIFLSLHEANKHLRLLPETNELCIKYSEKITRTLQSENVDISHVRQTSGQPSSFSTIINFKRERTIFSEHVKRKHEFDFENIATKW